MQVQCINHGKSMATETSTSRTWTGHSVLPASLILSHPLVWIELISASETVRDDSAQDSSFSACKFPVTF